MKDFIPLWELEMDRYRSHPILISRELESQLEWTTVITPPDLTGDQFVRQCSRFIL